MWCVCRCLRARELVRFRTDARLQLLCAHFMYICFVCEATPITSRVTRCNGFLVPPVKCDNQEKNQVLQYCYVCSCCARELLLFGANARLQLLQI
jgi:hypothetical protein